MVRDGRENEQLGSFPRARAQPAPGRRLDDPEGAPATHPRSFFKIPIDVTHLIGHVRETDDRLFARAGKGVEGRRLHLDGEDPLFAAEFDGGLRLAEGGVGRPGGAALDSVRNPGEGAPEGVEELAALGEVAALRADTSEEGSAGKIVAAVEEAFGGVDILVNNAGEMSSGRFEVLSDTMLQTQLGTKLFGFLRMIRAVVPHMRKGGWGRIVNMIGGAGKEPDPYMFGSGMTNSALLNLTKSLSDEFGEEGIHVNAVCPGWVDTDLWRRNADGLAAELDAGSEEEARRRAARKNALNRFGRPEELADAVAFLCSERTSYITGISLNLDGGRLNSLW